MRKFSRMEANKEVRRNLNRHGVDLSYAQYSVTGMEIRLTGWLCKHDSSDFNAAQIESMIMDFQRLLPGYSVCGQFDNWIFGTDHISQVGKSGEGQENSEEDGTLYPSAADPEAS
jgi:hypothetical protein